MTINPFEEKIDQLMADDQAELVIQQNEFMEFREAWVKHPRRKEIIGEAGLKGQITYRFVKAVEKSENSEGK